MTNKTDDTLTKENILSEDSRQHLPSLVIDAIGIIKSDFAYLYGIEELADHLEVSKHHLIRTFTAACGISPGKYLIIVRLEKAKAILRTGKVTPLEAVAAACGYSNANYLAKSFKKYTGYTPTEYATLAASEISKAEDEEIDHIIKRLYV